MRQSTGIGINRKRVNRNGTTSTTKRKGTNQSFRRVRRVVVVSFRGTERGRRSVLTGKQAVGIPPLIPGVALGCNVPPLPGGRRACDAKCALLGGALFLLIQVVFQR
jgi:hypothetical protein